MSTSLSVVGCTEVQGDVSLLVLLVDAAAERDEPLHQREVVLDGGEHERGVPGLGIHSVVQHLPVQLLVSHHHLHRLTTKRFCGSFQL